MSDVDDLLRRLGQEPVPARLAALDGEHLAAIAASRAGNLRRPVMVSSIFALLIGIAGAGFPVAPAAQASPGLFAVNSPLLPSTLLEQGAR